jgi:type IV secretory pathway protease TraF
VKQIAAIEGDKICARGGRILMYRKSDARTEYIGRKGRPLCNWHGCSTVRPGEIFPLLRGAKGPLESRYCSTIERSQIIGKLRPVWLFGN